MTLVTCQHPFAVAVNRPVSLDAVTKTCAGFQAGAVTQSFGPSGADTQMVEDAACAWPEHALTASVAVTARAPPGRVVSWGGDSVNEHDELAGSSGG